MVKIISRAEKKRRQIEERKILLVREVSKFCEVNADEKRVSISHPDYNALTKQKRELIATLKVEHGFYLQWKIWDIPAGQQIEKDENKTS